LPRIEPGCPGRGSDLPVLPQLITVNGEDRNIAIVVVADLHVLSILTERHALDTSLFDFIRAI
jgi:hypothetical protein